MPAPPAGTKITILAPSNDAFAALGEEVLTALAQNIPILREVLLGHILMEAVTTSDVTDGAPAASPSVVLPCQRHDELPASVRDLRALMSSWRPLLGLIPAGNGYIVSTMAPSNCSSALSAGAEYTNMNDRPVTGLVDNGAVSFQAPDDGTIGKVILADVQSCAGIVQVCYHCQCCDVMACAAFPWLFVHTAVSLFLCSHASVGDLLQHLPSQQRCVQVIDSVLIIGDATTGGGPGAAPAGVDVSGFPPEGPPAATGDYGGEMPGGYGGEAGMGPASSPVYPGAAGPDMAVPDFGAPTGSSPGTLPVPPAVPTPGTSPVPPAVPAPPGAAPGVAPVPRGPEAPGGYGGEASGGYGGAVPLPNTSGATSSPPDGSAGGGARPTSQS